MSNKSPLMRERLVQTLKAVGWIGSHKVEVAFLDYVSCRERLHIQLGDLSARIEPSHLERVVQAAVRQIPIVTVIDGASIHSPSPAGASVS